jgi:hypothetical protein
MLECSKRSFCGTPKKNYPIFKVRALEEKRDHSNLIKVSHYKAKRLVEINLLALEFYI